MTAMGSDADLISEVSETQGQVEIGVQQARKLRPDLSDDSLLEWAK